jgi:hypothetical protein
MKPLIRTEMGRRRANAGFARDPDGLYFAQ